MGYINRADMHMNQAEGTVRTYLINALDGLDLVMGEGFAKENPTFLLEYVKMCAMTYAADIIADALSGTKKL